MGRLRYPRLRILAVAALMGSTAACSAGGQGEGASSVATTLPPLPASDPPAPGDPTKAAARWETVATLTGSGPARTPSFTILEGAIQWRARYSCDTGTLRVTTDPPPRRPAALVDASCGAQGEGFSILTGPVSLTVEATGPWKLVVDQQVDTPLNEPLLPAMASGQVVAEGSFYNIEKNGKGSARLFRLPDGGHALRMEDFEVNQNTDLFVWLDTAVNPRTSKEAQSAEYWSLGNLKSTVGSQNYLIPPEIPVTRVNSVVIWCDPVSIAYAAAALS